MRVRLNSLSVAVSVGVLGLALAGCGEEARKTEPATPAGPSVTNEVYLDGEAVPAPAQTNVPVTPSMAVPTQSVPLPQNAAAAAVVSTPPLAAGELPPIFDQLEKPDYKAAYAPLFSGVTVAEWMRSGGTASPGHVVKIGGAEYELYSHCKPHDCGSNMMYVLFSRDHAHAWALSVANDIPTFFGNPDADVTAALKAAACKRVGQGC